VETLLANIAAKGRQAGPAAKPGESSDPVAGKVSHPVLYRYKPVENYKIGTFELINGSDLYTLVQGSPPGKVADRTAPAGGSAEAVIAAHKRDGWRPLGIAFAPFRKDADIPLKPLQGAEGNIKAVKGQYICTEFIILFIWREPTKDVAPPPAGGGGGAGAGPGAGGGAGKAAQPK
jgi:hypothetical protein